MPSDTVTSRRMSGLGRTLPFLVELPVPSAAFETELTRLLCWRPTREHQAASERTRVAWKPPPRKWSKQSN